MEMRPVHPFEPVTADRLPAGGAWTAQIKWDGVRMLTYYDGVHTRLVNRRLNDRTAQYPELTHAPDFVEASSVILDGEFIAFDRARPSFHEVMRRESLRKTDSIQRAIDAVPVTYMVFDVLFANGRWTVDLPLRERQALLEQVLRPHAQVQAVANTSDPEALFDVMRAHRMEGVVAKDLNSIYAIGGKDKRWRKKKVIRDLTAAVGGVTLRDGTVNALLLGLYDEAGDLHYIGHAGAGKLTYADYRALTEALAEMRTAARPFKNRVEREREAVWIRPGERAVKVNYLEWTEGGTLRQPVLQAFVDAASADCTFRQLQ
ncbi:ATP-dependent DNA ligase [Cohnella nanjingensis]|uniref:DNA ligase (ATP) n=1 Tax=Cohnella nanjingensis TaxID=1387779 RepID=A0A7X0RQG3_9BACL|nr:RNA ligase family protein [Cohnella nanjingensis]MBB6671675.1 DNA ligase [Cohnella nanjingensis]